jgi:hypothetical protein
MNYKFKRTCGPGPGYKKLYPAYNIIQKKSVPAADRESPAPVDFEMEPGSPVQQDINYTQGYLRQQIGKYVKVEFLIGTNMLVDREGTLVDVGISYIILREPETDDLVLADIYSIKFVRIYY